MIRLKSLYEIDKLDKINAVDRRSEQIWRDVCQSFVQLRWGDFEEN